MSQDHYAKMFLSRPKTKTSRRTEAIKARTKLDKGKRHKRKHVQGLTPIYPIGILQINPDFKIYQLLPRL